MQLQNGKYLASIMEQSAIMRDRITEEETKAVRAKFHEKHAICET